MAKVVVGQRSAILAKEMSAATVTTSVEATAAAFTEVRVVAAEVGVRAPAQPLVAPLSAMTPHAGGRWLVMSPKATQAQAGRVPNMEGPQGCLEESAAGRESGTGSEASVVPLLSV